MRKILLRICLFHFFLIGKFLFSQGATPTGANFFPQSPNSTPFAVNGKIPVNMYKGTPSINIPLFNKTINGKSLDVSLNYNIKSVKPETIPTWAGLGWNLQVGGSISRIVNGGVDEVYQSLITPNNRFSYLDNYSTLNNPSWASLQSMQNYTTNNLATGSSFSDPVPNPDEFIINFCGITGSFYLNEKGQWIGRTREGKTFMVSYNYKSDYILKEKTIRGSSYLTPLNTTIKRILYGFTITLDDGTQAVFGNDDNALEFTSTAENIDSFNPQIIVSNWYLKELKFIDNKKILFSYTRDDKAVFLNNKGGNIFYHKQGSSGWVSNSSFGGNFNQIISNRLHNTYLTKIEGDDFTINFNKSLSNQKEYNDLSYAIGTWGGIYTHHMSSYGNFKHWYKLDNINITDKAGTVIKNIVFNHNNDPSDRLLLNNVTINGIEKYDFKYNPQKLPDYLSTSTDAWEYYNGNTFLTANNSAGLPQDQLKNLLVNNYPPSKIPNLSLSKASTLEQVTYPTGGSSYFTYELNNYSKYGEKISTETPLKINSTTSDEVAGGLRIQKIKSCDENNNCFFKTYSYVNDDGRSSGILPYKPTYMFEGSEPSINLVFWEWSTHSYQSLKDEDNSVGYSKVTEIDDNGGKKETYFTNFDNPDFNDVSGLVYYGWNNIGIYKQLPYTSYALMRGKPSKEVVYSTSKKISETNYLYSKSTDFIKSYAFIYKQFGQPINSGPFIDLGGVSYGTLLDAHNINFNTSFLTQKKTVFENIETTETNTYNYVYNTPVTQTQTESDGTTYLTTYKYASDINNQPMLNSYMVGIPVSKESKKGNKIISKTETVYPTSLPTPQTGNIILPTSVLSYNLQTPTVTSTEMLYDKYDSKGNLQQYTTKDGLSIAIVWGYNQTQPIARIEGAKLSDISQTLIDSIVGASANDAQLGTDASEQSLISALDLFRNNSALAGYQVSTYTYDPLIGVTSITPPSGIRELYKYDSANRLEKVIDINGKILKEYKYNYKN
ncbi:hypothetical protein [Chryseobacterium luteum]|uniref:YD repeat-containing protein n=1 Tax=Chryseobacterium luteum TaxID=421531 RepID=A0A085ZBL0_9FLAO|nr:hypothetical protein [Chryseobacterium luteum]KFF01824.1 hypothetical protein IX38_15100 [Chryseobacterium luteum]